MLSICEDNETQVIHMLPCFIGGEDLININQMSFFKPTIDNSNTHSDLTLRASFRGRSIYGHSLDLNNNSTSKTTAIVLCENQKFNLNQIILWELSDKRAESELCNIKKIVALMAICGQAFQ